MADLGFIDDLWFDRGGGLDESMRLVDLIKASFGGDRSAAGRYAAEQKWKGHVKKQPAAQSNPYNLQFSENLGAQLSLMGAAMRTVEDSGVDTQVFGRSDLTPDDIESMDD